MTTGNVGPMDYRANLPHHMSALPSDEAGRPVPAFVEYVDHKPDFRIMSSHHLRDCVIHDRCWVCGQKLGKFGAFVVGPMCLVNLNTAEPPSHYDCAFYSATHCPFLINPNKVRREANLPDDYRQPAGEMISRNPGVTAIIVTTGWAPRRVGNGILFSIGMKRPFDPPEFIDRVEFYREGRPATRAEVIDSIVSGTPILAESCNGEPACLAALNAQVDAAMKWLPAA